MELFIEKRKKRLLSDLKASPRQKEISIKENASFDMRINLMKSQPNNIVKIKLAFRLDYYPRAYLDAYSLILVLDVIVEDLTNKFKNNPLDEFWIKYIASLYMQSADRLYEKLDMECKSQLGHGIKENYFVSENDAFAQCKIILGNYFR